MIWNRSKTKAITEEEYAFALERLSFIDNERNILKNSHTSQVYNAHINLPGTFDELKINLQRKNVLIDQEINALKHKYLAIGNYQESIKNILEQCVYLLEHSSNENLEQENFFQTMDSKFKGFVQEAKNLISHKQGHLVLLRYILQLEQEEKNCRTIISLYERQRNKQSSFFKR